MVTLRRAAEQALAAIKSANQINYSWACVEAVAVLEAALAETINFCPRCGKRTQDIHTCTPPADSWAYPTNNIAP